MREARVIPEGARTSGLSSGRFRFGPTSASGAIAPDFHACDGNLESAFLLHLFLQAVKKSALKLRYSSTTQAGHVDMLARGLALVKMFLALQVHEIEFVNQAVPFQKTESSIDGDAIDLKQAR